MAAWYEAVETVTPHVVQIRTPRGSGTGFLFLRSKDGKYVGIATAAHVIEHCYYWGEPLRIFHALSNEPVLLREADRALFVDSRKDTAAIFMAVGKLSLPPTPLGLLPEEKFVKVGNETGWLGYPAIPSADLCFFSGRISAWLQDELAYLVDGVAINGVSGGPAFFLFGETPTLMGVLSAYIPNRATGEVLPGVAVVRDVSHFHELLKDFKSVEDAKKEETPPTEPPAPPVGDDPSSQPPTGRT